MSRLNYRHLRYFLAVAHEGTVTAAARSLNVTQPTVSSQLARLEASLGHELFDRTGSSMVLTPAGRTVLEYAEEIFQLGEELQATVRGGSPERPIRLSVGLAGTIPNLVAFHLLEPVFILKDPLRLIVRENRTDRLMADLATHQLDLVLADMPVPPNVSVRAFNHPLGSSAIRIFGPPLMAARLRDGFPGSLDGAPFLLPAEGYVLRRSLEDWFARIGVRPLVVAEIEDNDLINVLAESGAGLFAAPAIIDGDIRVRYAVEVVGEAEGVREDFYVITSDRHLRHPAIVAITAAARAELAEP